MRPPSASGSPAARPSCHGTLVTIRWRLEQQPCLQAQGGLVVQQMFHQWPTTYSGMKTADKVAWVLAVDVRTMYSVTGR